MWTLIGFALAAIAVTVHVTVGRNDWLSDKEAGLVGAICTSAVSFCAAMDGARLSASIIALLAGLLWLAWWFADDDDNPRKRRKRLRSKIKSHIPRPRIVAVRPIQQGA